MSRWYESRTNQGALIGGVSLIIAAVFGAILSGGQAEPYPALQLRTVVEGSPQVLAQIAFSPLDHLRDRASLEELGGSYRLLDDSIGIALAAPSAQEWTVGSVGSPTMVSEFDIPIIRSIFERQAIVFAFDTVSLDFFGARLDHATTIELERESGIQGFPVGENPFRNPQFADAVLRLIVGPEEVDAAPMDERADARAYLIEEHDSIVDANLPLTKEVYAGVYITQIDLAQLPTIGPMNWLYMQPLEKATTLFKSVLVPDDFLLVDRAAGLSILNQSVVLSDVVVDGQPADAFVINRVGFVVSAGRPELFFAVIMQFPSNTPEPAVNELRRMFESVRLGL